VRRTCASELRQRIQRHGHGVEVLGREHTLVVQDLLELSPRLVSRAAVEVGEAAEVRDGFVMMPNEVEAYRTGPDAFEFKGTNGFMITVDVSSKDFGS
jgi:hypothetical protein